MKLFLCTGCARHVKEATPACPFCGVHLRRDRPSTVAQVARRRSRAALVAGASTMVALSQCSAYGAPPPCVDSVTLHSPCGITQVTTNCTGASTSDCSSGSCGVGPIAGNCAITVTLGDGTKHVVAVDASANASCKGVIVTVPYGGNEWFVSPTCPNTTD